MKSLNRFLLLAAVLLAGLFACDDDNNDEDNEPKPDVCTPNAHVDTAAVRLEPNGPRFVLTGGPARKDCHARFLLTYRWADDTRARTDSMPPPLGWTFQTHPGIFYFPTPNAARRQDEQGWYWEATNDIGARNQEEDYVEYEIEAYAPDYASEDILVKSARVDYVRYE